MTRPGRLRAIAFYLPQFHPIPENDAWWGRGFTEWTNVARARPLFRGHHQPRVPADLGFYDLRLPETRAAQAELAAAHGLDGFCYWHYWFHGRRFLERPFAEVLASGEPSFPFCLAWANESWSRRWLGEDRDILVRQTYSTEDDRQHARWLVRAFGDPRYLRIDGRPLFLIYRPHDLPNPAATLDALREEAFRRGVGEPYVLGINAHCPDLDCRPLGFDGTVDYAPQLGVLPGLFGRRGMNDARVRLSTLARNLRLGVPSPRLRLFDYGGAWRRMASRRRPFPTQPCVFVGWDNTPRRGPDGIVLLNATPEAFERALRQAIRRAPPGPGGERLVFVNAWNEWAEGNYLEPDLRHGRAYLEAVRRALAGEATGSTTPPDAEMREPPAAVLRA